MFFYGVVTPLVFHRFEHDRDRVVVDGVGLAEQPLPHDFGRTLGGETDACNRCVVGVLQRPKGTTYLHVVSNKNETNKKGNTLEK